MPTINTDEIDLRLNCAAEICCGRSSATSTTAAMLEEHGVPSDICEKVADSLHNKGIVLLPAQLSQVIRAIAFPGSKAETQNTQ